MCSTTVYSHSLSVHIAVITFILTYCPQEIAAKIYLLHFLLLGAWIKENWTEEIKQNRNQNYHIVVVHPCQPVNL